MLEEDDEVRSGEDDLDIEEETSEAAEKTGGLTSKSETFKHLRETANFADSARRREGTEDAMRGQ